MNDQDIKVFIEIICHYFKTTTQSVAELQSPVIEMTALNLGDYTGFLHVSGSSQGWIYISMSRAMLVDILACYGEPQTDDTMLRDGVGEIASTISNNARAHFGSQFEISVPTSISAKEKNPMDDNILRFVLPFQWRQHSAKLGIALKN